MISVGITKNPKLGLLRANRYLLVESNSASNLKFYCLFYNAEFDEQI